MTLRLAIFDCDGTLVDSAHNIVAAMRACFAEAALPPPSDADTRRIVGLSLVEAMRALHPDGTPDSHALLAGSYKSCFHRMRQQGAVHEPLFDGIAEALAALEEEGWLLGVATGKSDRGLDLVLAGHGLAPRFVTLQTADRHPSKPHPAMIEAAMAATGVARADTVMIGDTSFDMAMAVQAGVAGIGVAWGYHAPDELFAAGARAVALHASDLPRLCREAVA